MKRKPKQRYVRVDCLEAWGLIRCLSETTPKTKLLVVTSAKDPSMLLALIASPNGPWVLDERHRAVLTKVGDDETRIR